jgi:hypothetical protein
MCYPTGVRDGWCSCHYGADRTPLRPLRRPAAWLFLAYTRLAYRRLARRVAAQIVDYVRSGHTVECVLGIAALRRELRRRRVEVPFDEHDLLAEITR